MSAGKREGGGYYRKDDIESVEIGYSLASDNPIGYNKNTVTI